MPLFEYVCKECSKEFEALVMGSRKAECPACGGNKLEQKLSSFSARSAAPKASAPSGGCGSCGDSRGPGSCSMN
jgi:putative FmdB family regulatory protein